MPGTSCERPGCSQAGDVEYGFLADPYVIWLDRTDSGHPNRTRAGVLCTRHADAMVPPIGWSMDDRRVEVAQLFATAAAPSEDAAPAPRPTRARRARRPASDDTQELSLFDPDGGVDTTALAGDTLPSAQPWQPLFDGDDDLGGLLDAKSPLLARAFRAGAPSRAT